MASDSLGFEFLVLGSELNIGEFFGLLSQTNTSSHQHFWMICNSYCLNII